MTFSVKDQGTLTSDATGLACPSQLPVSDAAARRAARRPKCAFRLWTPECELHAMVTYREALLRFPFSSTTGYCKNHSWLTDLVGSGGIWPTGQFADPS